QIVDTRVGVGFGVLRGVRIGTDVEAVQFVDGEVRESVLTRELQGGDGVVVSGAVVSDTELVGDAGREGVILGEGCQVIRALQVGKEHRQLGADIDVGVLVVNVTAADLVLIRHVVIHRRRKELTVLVVRCRDGYNPDLNGRFVYGHASTRTNAGGDLTGRASRRRDRVLLETGNVVLVESR